MKIGLPCRQFPFKWIDLTHPLTEDAPTWEGVCGFKYINHLDYADCTSDVKFRVQSLSLFAGIGTHMDAPAHCDPSGKTIDAISLNDCFAPCVVIDISAKADETYLCSKQDILDFEAQFGEIEPGDFIIIRTGWDRYWTSPEKYRNNLQFPTVSQEAAKLLVDRDIVGLGIDTLSPDTADSGYPVHQIILGSGKYLVENVANSHLLSPKDSYIIALPLLIVGGTEAPIRLIGLVK